MTSNVGTEQTYCSLIYGERKRGRERERERERLLQLLLLLPVTNRRGQPKEND